VLPHPGSADLASDPIRVFGGLELQDQDEMPLVDLDDARSEGARVDDHPNSIRHRAQGRIGRRIPQAQVVDDDVHRRNLTGTAASRR